MIHTIQEKFVINDITAKIEPGDRLIKFVEDDNGLLLSFNTYGEALATIELLPIGYYQVDKIFVVAKSHSIFE